MNWQTSGNWDVLPVSGRGDTLIIPSGTSTSNDFTGLKIKALWFTGAEATAVSGNELEFSVAGSKKDFNLSNACPLQVDLPVKVTKNFFGYYAASGVDYLKSVSVVGDVQFTFGKADAQPGEQGVCNFFGTVSAPDGTVGPGQGHNGTAYHKGIHFYGAVFAKVLKTYGNYNNDYFLHSPGGDVKTVEVGFSHVFAMAENALGAACVMKWLPESVYYPFPAAGKNPENGRVHSYYDMGGFNQTVDRIDAPSYPYKAAAVYDPPTTFAVISENPMTLTMRATQSGFCGAEFSGAVGVDYAPSVAGLTETFSNRIHTTSGELSVSNGTVKIVGATTFANVPAIRLQEAGVLDLQTTAAGCFSSLSRLTLAAGAVCRIGEMVDAPFGTAKPDLVVDDGAYLEIPEGMTLTVRSLLQNGEYQFGMTLTSGFVRGGGSLVVEEMPQEGASYWKRARSGEWNEGANWTNGRVPAESDEVFVDVRPGDYALSLTTPVTLSGGMRVLNDCGSVTLAVSNDFTYVGTSLVARTGSEILVGENGAFAVSPPAGTARDAEVMALDGARLTVDGGRVDMTGGSEADKSDDNFHGQFTVSGSPGRPGVIEVRRGEFLFTSWWGGVDGNFGSHIEIGPCGRLEITGGLADVRTGWWWNEPLSMNGGEVVVSGTGRFVAGCRSGSENGVAGYFGDGTVIFRDDAVFSAPRSNQTRLYVPAVRSGREQHLEMSFEDRAQVSMYGSLYVQCPMGALSDTFRETTVRVAFNSQATHSVHDLCIGGNLGLGEVNFNCGSLVVSNSLSLGFNDAFTGRSQSLDPKGVLSLNDGLLQVLGRFKTTDTKPYGLLVGNTLPLPSGSYKCLDIGLQGELNVRDGALTNRNGLVLVGSGRGRGTVRQAGGEIASESQLPCLIGFLGGVGSYAMTGGTSRFSGDVYVGGATLERLEWSKLTTTGSVGGETLDLATCHDAVGVLSVSNGTFRTDADVILSADGVGTLELAASGVVKAVNMRLENGVSTVRFRLDESGECGVALDGCLTVSEGTKLVIDASAWDGQGRARRLFSCAEMDGVFSDADITVIGARFTHRLRQTQSGVTFGSERGMMLILR